MPGNIGVVEARTLATRYLIIDSELFEKSLSSCVPGGRSPFCSDRKSREAWGSYSIRSEFIAESMTMAVSWAFILIAELGPLLSYMGLIENLDWTLPGQMTNLHPLMILLPSSACDS